MSSNPATLFVFQFQELGSYSPCWAFAWPSYKMLPLSPGSALLTAVLPGLLVLVSAPILDFHWPWTSICPSYTNYPLAQLLLARHACQYLCVFFCLFLMTGPPWSWPPALLLLCYLRSLNLDRLLSAAGPEPSICLTSTTSLGVSSFSEPSQSGLSNYHSSSSALTRKAGFMWLKKLMLAVPGAFPRQQQIGFLWF